MLLEMSKERVFPMLLPLILTLITDKQKVKWENLRMLT
jgi:hypothetical protein